MYEKGVYEKIEKLKGTSKCKRQYSNCKQYCYKCTRIEFNPFRDYSQCLSLSGLFFSLFFFFCCAAHDPIYKKMQEKCIWIWNQTHSIRGALVKTMPSTTASLSLQVERVKVLHYFTIMDIVERKRIKPAEIIVDRWNHIFNLVADAFLVIALSFYH